MHSGRDPSLSRRERGALAADVVNDPAGAVAELGESMYDAYSATTEDVANLLSSGGQSVIEVMGLAADSFTGALSWFHDMWGVTTADPERRRLDEAEWCIPSGRRLSESSAEVASAPLSAKQTAAMHEAEQLN